MSKSDTPAAVRPNDGLGGTAPERADLMTALLEELERDSFEHWITEGGKWPKAAERNGPDYRLMGTHLKWQAWKARGALRQPCRGVMRTGCNYMAPCGVLCRKCGQQH